MKTSARSETRIETQTQTRQSRLEDRLGGGLLFDQPLSELCSFGVGGPLQYLYKPGTTRELQDALLIASELAMPTRFVGLGSRVLAGDWGFKGLGIRLGGALAQVAEDPQDPRYLLVGAGCPIETLLPRALEHGIDASCLAGLTGSLGGALLAGDPGYDAELRTLIDSAEVIDREGRVRWVVRARSQTMARLGGFAALTRVRLGPRDPHLDQELAAARAKACQEFRQAFRPEGPFLGPIFKNPEGQLASHMVDRAGLRGARIGQAQFSLVQSNYLVNLGGATARDALELMDLATYRVKRKLGCSLQLEVQLMGAF